jgi:hypothetical protein
VAGPVVHCRADVEKKPGNQTLITSVATPPTRISHMSLESCKMSSYGILHFIIGVVRTSTGILGNENVVEVAQHCQPIYKKVAWYCLDAQKTSNEQCKSSGT